MGVALAQAGRYGARRAHAPWSVDVRGTDGRWTPWGRYGSRQLAEFAVEDLVADGMWPRDWLRVRRALSPRPEPG
jgi:hypothetical protein